MSDGAAGSARGTTGLTDVAIILSLATYESPFAYRDPP